MSSSPIRIAAAAAALIAALSCGCNGEKTKAAPSSPRGPAGVVLVTVDALRPRDLAIYGGPVEMPSLGRLAKAGTVYEDVLSVSPMTRPAVATVLTGVAPDRTMVREDTDDRLPAGIATLGELYRAAGRTTAAFVTTPSVSLRSGLERGFEVFDGPEVAAVGLAGRFPAIRPTTEATDHFAEWLASVPKDRTFFAWVHVGELRIPSTDPIADRARTAYAASLANVDRAVERILQSLEQRGWSDRTEIVFAGTGGDLQGEDGRWGSAFWLTDGTLRVALIRKLAGAATGTRDGRKAWLPDVPRTLAAEIGGSLDARAEGEDLSGAPAAGRVRRAWTWAPDDQAAWPVVTAVDAGDGLVAFEGADVERSTVAKQRPAVPRERKIPAEARARIEGAGIRLGGTPPPPMPSREIRDEFLVDLTRLDAAFAEGRFPRVKKHMDLVQKAAPESFATLEALAFRAQIRGEEKPTRETSNALLARYPDRRESLHWAAHAELLAKKIPRAEALLEAAEAMGAPDADVLYDLACTRSLSGDAKRGLAYLAESIDAGFQDWEWMEKDTDLTAVRADPGFADLMRKHGR